MTDRLRHHHCRRAHIPFRRENYLGKTIREAISIGFPSAAKRRYGRSAVLFTSTGDPQYCATGRAVGKALMSRVIASRSPPTKL